jgi:hypothetical protein
MVEFTPTPRSIDPTSLPLPVRRLKLSNGWKAVRVRDNRRAPRYYAGEYVLFDGSRICGRAASRGIEQLPEVRRQLEAQHVEVSR